jgi:hypothetical protein
LDIDGISDILLRTLVQVIAPILVTVISGYLLLRSHHLKVQAELLYPRMQQAYDQILDLVNAEYDYSFTIPSDELWIYSHKTKKSCVSRIKRSQNHEKNSGM